MPYNDNMTNPKVSIVINNYNYAKYLPYCIDSALAQTYENLEIIVVDDGSTDNSRAIITQYGNKILPVFKNNGGQGSAYNAGFAVSTGEWVLFLDADDALLPQTITSVIQSIEPGVAKIQFQLEVIDANNHRSGVYVPTADLTSGDVTKYLLRYGNYVSPPASGNIYLRSALQQILPMKEQIWKITADTVPIYLVPFIGKVKSLQQPLGYYRIHHTSYISVANRPFEKVVGELQIKTQLLHDAAKCFKRQLPSENVSQNNPPTAKLLFACKLIKPNHPGIQNYKLATLCMQGIKITLQYPLYSLKHRTLLAAWFLLAFISKGKLRDKIVQYGLRPLARGKANAK
jgi:glycosyltransferase involved in cell wall biosynthesis